MQQMRPSYQAQLLSHLHDPCPLTSALQRADHNAAHPDPGPHLSRLQTQRYQPDEPLMQSDGPQPDQHLTVCLVKKMELPVVMHGWQMLQEQLPEQLPEQLSGQQT